MISAPKSCNEKYRSPCSFTGKGQMNFIASEQTSVGKKFLPFKLSPLKTYFKPS